MNSFENDQGIEALLDFCLASSVIVGYDCVDTGIAISTGVGRWILSSEQAMLYLLGTLKYRPDLLLAWTVKGRTNDSDKRSGIAA